jgi:ornithine cyclodeaminase/alanine dehydrogenase-like protein (mu-crystallin family)
LERLKYISSPLNQGGQKFERIKSKNKTWAFSDCFSMVTLQKQSRNPVIKRGNLHKHLHSKELPP